MKWLEDNPGKMIVGFLLVVAAVLFWIFMKGVTDPPGFEEPHAFNFSTRTGPIGDTIGGIAGPMLSFCGLLLVYFSMREQINLNRRQFTAWQVEREAGNVKFAAELIQMLQITCEKEIADYRLNRVRFPALVNNPVTDAGLLVPAFFRTLHLFEICVEHATLQSLTVQSRGALAAIFRSQVRERYIEFEILTCEIANENIAPVAPVINVIRRIDALFPERIISNVP